MKILLELLVSFILHPLAMILMWLNVLGRRDLTGLQKLVWLIVSIVWGIGPFLYVLVGGGQLW